MLCLDVPKINCPVSDSWSLNQHWLLIHLKPNFLLIPWWSTLHWLWWSQRPSQMASLTCYFLLRSLIKRTTLLYLGLCMGNSSLLLQWGFPGYSWWMWMFVSPGFDDVTFLLLYVLLFRDVTWWDTLLCSVLSTLGTPPGFFKRASAVSFCWMFWVSNLVTS